MLPSQFQVKNAFGQFKIESKNDRKVKNSVLKLPESNTEEIAGRIRFSTRQSRDFLTFGSVYTKPVLFFMADPDQWEFPLEKSE